MGETKLSFIIPVYNAAEYIDKCITSIMNQSYGNFEIILVDDGSNDDSYEIIRGFEEKFENIIAITQENGGPSKARNMGIELSTGDYIAFVDADDYLDLDFGLRMVEKAGGDKADLVVCNYIEVNNMGEINVDIFKELGGGFVDEKDICIKEILTGPGGLVWGKLFRRSVIESKNIRFNEEYKMCEDLLFCIEYINEVSKARQATEYLYIHNKCNENSITAKYTSDMFYKQLRVQEDIEDLLKKCGMYKDSTKEMMSGRLKNILEYSIDRECNDRKQKKFRTKIENIYNIISDKRVEHYYKVIQGNGPVDKAIVKSIKNKNSKRLFLFIKIRYFIVYIYSKIKKLRRRLADVT